jgi:iron(III) transport system substrate-binding protein
MQMKLLKAITLGSLITSGFILGGCGDNTSTNEKSVTMFCALDQIFSEKVIEPFNDESGMTIKPVFDTEATKTVGLVNRIIAEKNNPKCDVFWNNEIVRTIILKRKGLLQPYVSVNAESIPELFKDKEGWWTGFGARSRVLIYNKKLLKAEQLPTSIFDLTKPEWKDKVAMALPLFGTTATHAAALFVEFGDEKALQFFKDLKANGVKIVSGNGSARDLVVRGEYPIAFTDTDDAYSAMQKGADVGVIFPDQNSFGTLVIPNTAALVKGAPHLEEAKKLIDFIVSKKNEQALALCGSAQMPVRSGMKVAPGGWSVADIKAQAVDWEKVADKMEPVAKVMREMFVQ